MCGLSLCLVSLSREPGCPPPVFRIGWPVFASPADTTSPGGPGEMDEGGMKACSQRALRCIIGRALARETTSSLGNR